MQWITRQQWDRFNEEGTDAHRVCTGRNGWLDRYGRWVLESRAGKHFADAPQDGGMRELMERYDYAPDGWLVRELAKDARFQTPPQLVYGDAPGQIVVREWDVGYHVDPGGGYSTGLFLDQRMNRRWIKGLRPKHVLNLFAYTGSFSVCAALAGAETTSVDIAKRSLDVARANFDLNGICTQDGHRFVVEDAARYVSRLLRRGESFDAIVLDPPTFGRAGRGVFRLEHDLPALVRDCRSLLSAGGWMLVSCNYAKWNANKLRDICSGQPGGTNVELRAGELPDEIPHGAVSCRLHKITV